MSGKSHSFLVFLDLLIISLLLIGATLARISTTFVNFVIVIGLGLCWSVIPTVYHLYHTIIFLRYTPQSSTDATKAQLVTN